MMDTEQDRTTIEAMDESWQRLLAVVAHPDDLEYGAASAIARWTNAGKEVAYVIATSGEAGIDSLSPAEAGPLREAEEFESAAIVGVTDVTFLGYQDGVVPYSIELRRDIARQIRRTRPDVLLIATHELTFGGNMLNQPDHRNVGLAALDAAKDAGNRWIFPELVEEGHQPWNGTSLVYVMGSEQPTHGVDVTDYLDRGIASLEAHRAYVDGLGRDFNPTEFLQGFTALQGAALGVPNGVLFGQLSLAGI